MTARNLVRVVGLAWFAHAFAYGVPIALTLLVGLASGRADLLTVGAILAILPVVSTAIGVRAIRRPGRRLMVVSVLWGILAFAFALTQLMVTAGPAITTPIAGLMATSVAAVTSLLARHRLGLEELERCRAEVGPG